MPKTTKRKQLYDEVRFELDKLFQDLGITRVDGHIHPSKTGAHRILLTRVVPLRGKTIFIRVEDYPKLKWFIRSLNSTEVDRLVFEQFIRETLAIHPRELANLFLSKMVRFKLRPGGCVSFDGDPGTKFKHVAFGVPTRDTIKRPQVDHP